MMNEFIKDLNALNAVKDDIIKAVIEIETKGFSKTQAQNFREYSTKTTSIEELKLYLDYQCARDRKLKQAVGNLKKIIDNYKDKGIHVTRYILGTFARHVIINSKRWED